MGRLPYEERLWVPVSWWIVTVAIAGSFWLALWAALPSVVMAHLLGGLAVALVVAGLGWYGALGIEVSSTTFRAGRAALPLAAVGSVVALTADQARALRGPSADASAYLVVRPYVPRAVRVEVTDADDPTPYWYVATRRPERLVTALEAARDSRTA
jgi:hypothetical protein